MWWKIVLLQVGFFAVLIFALKSLFHKQLVGAITRMEKLQDHNRRKEEELKQRQEMVREECDKKLEAVNKEILAARTSVAEEIRIMNNRARGVLEEQKSALLTEMTAREKSLKRRIEQEAEDRASTVALGILLDVFSVKMLEALHKELVEELLNSFDKDIPQKIEIKNKRIRVFTAFHLTPEQKNRLFEGIKRWVEPESQEGIVLADEYDPDLVAGFIFSLDERIFDGSLKNRFEQRVNKTLR